MLRNDFRFSQEQLGKIADLIRKEAGITLDEKRLMRFRRKIEEVAEKNALFDFSAFYHRLRYQKDHELLQEIVNAVTINETYFWRESDQFEYLARELLPCYINGKEMRHVRILVAPCSSGEEVYSIMFAILDNEKILERLNIEIVGIDIDSSMIQKARDAVYSPRSVEKLPRKYLHSYFQKVGGFYHLKKELRILATFLQANIFNETLQEKLGRFDIVFSRNMLIYFNDEDKQKTFEIFHTLLKPGGVLFLGHADANRIDRKLFVPIAKGSHIYRKRAPLNE